MLLGCALALLAPCDGPNCESSPLQVTSMMSVLDQSDVHKSRCRALTRPVWLVGVACGGFGFRASGLAHQLVCFQYWRGRGTGGWCGMLCQDVA